MMYDSKLFFLFQLYALLLSSVVMASSSLRSSEVSVDLLGIEIKNVDCNENPSTQPSHSPTEGNCACKIPAPCLIQDSYPIACPLNIDFVCGCDGVTYTNGCFARKSGCNTFWRPGACPDYVFKSTDPEPHTFADHLTSTTTLSDTSSTCLFPTKTCEERRQFVCCHDFRAVTGCDGNIYSNRCYATQCGCNHDLDHIPTTRPTEIASSQPSLISTEIPTIPPSPLPTLQPTQLPTVQPAQVPSTAPSTIILPATATPSLNTTSQSQGGYYYYYDSYGDDDLYADAEGHEGGVAGGEEDYYYTYGDDIDEQVELNA